VFVRLVHAFGAHHCKSSFRGGCTLLHASPALLTPLLASSVQEAKHLQNALEGKNDLQFELQRVAQEASGLAAQLEDARAIAAKVSCCFGSCFSRPGFGWLSIALSHTRFGSILAYMAWLLLHAISSPLSVPSRWVTWSSSWQRPCGSVMACSAAPLIWRPRWVEATPGLHRSPAVVDAEERAWHAWHAGCLWLSCGVVSKLSCCGSFLLFTDWTDPVSAGKHHRGARAGSAAGS
jgi:hypothetical protein